MLTRRNEVIARALRGRSRQDRRGDFKEAVLVHRLAQGGDDVAAHDDVLLHIGVAQVEIAVLQADALVRLAGAVNLERQLIVAAAPQHVDFLRLHLNVARGNLRILVVAFAHDAGHGDDALLVEAADDFHLLLVVNNDLRRAIEIAQDDEREVRADDAHAIHPAGQLHALTRVRQPQFVACMSTVLHICSSFLSSERETRGALPLDPAKGSSTLWTPIFAIELVTSSYFFRVLIGGDARALPLTCQRVFDPLDSHSRD